MQDNGNSIIISGFGVRLPKDVNTVYEVHNVLLKNVCQLSLLQDSKTHAFNKKDLSSVPPNAGIYENTDLFDNQFFGISNKIAQDMDPQHRFALECCMESIVDANLDLNFLQKLRTGVFVGAACSDSMDLQFLNKDFITPYTMQGSTIGNIANL